MVMLLGIAITHDLRHRDEMTSMPAGFRCLKSARRGLSKLTLYRHRGSIDCRRCQYEDFAGSEVSIFTLEKAYSAGVTRNNRKR